MYLCDSVLTLKTTTGRLSSAVIYFTLDSEANEDPPEFILTCQSRGGPVTEVEWMRNGVKVEEDSNHMTSQNLVDTSVNTVYNNTLRVRGRESGTYKCTVSNNRHEYFENDNSQNGFTNTRVVNGRLSLLSKVSYIFSSLFVFSYPGICRSQCYLQVTYHHFTGVDICPHTHLLIFLCGILSVWRRELQCDLHH